MYWVELGPLAQSLLTWQHDLTCLTILSAVCFSVCGGQVVCVCRLTEFICTGVCGRPHCVFICGALRPLCQNVFLLSASVLPVFSRLCHCLGTNIIV